MRIVAIPTLIFLFVSITQIDVVNAQTVSVGKGSYSTTLPAGAVGPSTISGLPAVPKISTEFNQLVNTNDYWSSLIFPRQENKNSNAIYAHPLTIQAKKFGFRVGLRNETFKGATTVNQLIKLIKKHNDINGFNLIDIDFNLATV